MSPKMKSYKGKINYYSLACENFKRNKQNPEFREPKNKKRENPNFSNEQVEELQRRYQR